MGNVHTFAGSMSQTMTDVVTAANFDECMVVSPGVYWHEKGEKTAQYNDPELAISNGSKIFIFEGTAAFIYDQTGLVETIAKPGRYEYLEDPAQPSNHKYIAFVNLREITKFGFRTRGPSEYFDRYYGTDLEIMWFGKFSFRIADPVVFVQNFPRESTSFHDFFSSVSQLEFSTELNTAFCDALSSLSEAHRLSEMRSETEAIRRLIVGDHSTPGSLMNRYGLMVSELQISSLEYTTRSSTLIESLTPEKAVANTTLDEQIEAVKKLKYLVDTGILTQEEFEAKKKQILGI
ncbi:MAG: SPFH domain-containing protein [Microbacteriaceae bacterium]